MPGDRAARFRASGHRLRAWRMIVESKSLKLYLQSFRNHGAFHEDCTVRIGKDLVGLLKPRWFRIGGYWFPRGGMPSTCSGRAASRRRGSGSPIRASRPIAAAADGSSTIRFSLSRPVCSKRRQPWPQELGDLPPRLIGCAAQAWPTRRHARANRSASACRSLISAKEANGIGVPIATGSLAPMRAFTSWKIRESRSVKLT